MDELGRAFTSCRGIEPLRQTYTGVLEGHDVQPLPLDPARKKARALCLQRSRCPRHHEFTNLMHDRGIQCGSLLSPRESEDAREGSRVEAQGRWTQSSGSGVEGGVVLHGTVGLAGAERERLEVLGRDAGQHQA